MNSLHPHWHATGDEESSSQESPVRSSQPAHVDIVPASRLPAAFTGIAVAVVIGMTAAGAWKPLLAQIAGAGQSSAATTSAQHSSLAAVEVHITKEGFSPATIVVKPGQKITWINDQTIPHILTSQTLRNQSGSYLNTPAIFPKGKGNFTVGTKELDREHTYGSTTDKKLVGTVIVSKEGQPIAQATSSTDPCRVGGGNTGIFGGLDDINLPTGRGVSSDCPPASSSSTSPKPVSPAAPVKQSVSSSSAQAVTLQSSSSPLASVAASLPAAPAFPDGTSLDLLNSAPPLTGTVTGPIIPENIYAPATPEPHAQPETGAGVWIVAIMALSGLFVNTRKYFRRLS